MTNAERDAMRDYIVATIKGTVAATVAQIVVPPGPPGEKGADGKDGRDGKDAVVDVDAIVKQVAALVPAPKDGKDAEPVDRVALAKDVLALIPVPRDGRDGVATLDELRAEVAKAVESVTAAEVEKRVAEAFAALPVLRYRGVYKQGEEYQPGECATFGGSLFHCNEPTTEKPETGKAWTLAVKRGRDGKDVR